MENDAVDYQFMLLDGKSNPILYLESPDELMEDNFEEVFRDALLSEDISDLHKEIGPGEDFSDIAKHGIVEVVGDDVYGRKVITIYACRLPSNKSLDFNHLLK